jgi:hypothetical protein
MRAFIVPRNGASRGLRTSVSIEMASLPFGNAGACCSDYAVAVIPPKRHANMKPSKSILDRSFRYVPSVATSVASTWRRFGWRPTTADERSRRLVQQAALSPIALPRLDVATGA